MSKAQVDPPLGRPRDPRIAEAVLEATRALLVEVGYSDVTLAAIALRAGTNKPAIYRRWPTKAHLIHEAAFPEGGAQAAATEDDLRAAVTSLVRGAAELFSQPVVRAATPGLLAELASDPTLHTRLVSRFQDSIWGQLHRRLQVAVEAGEAREDVSADVIVEALTGAVLMALSLRAVRRLDDDWIAQTVDLLMKGIA